MQSYQTAHLTNRCDNSSRTAKGQIHRHRPSIRCLIYITHRGAVYTFNIPHRLVCWGHGFMQIALSPTELARWQTYQPLLQKIVARVYMPCLLQVCGSVLLTPVLQQDVPVASGWGCQFGSKANHSRPFEGWMLHRCSLQVRMNSFFDKCASDVIGNRTQSTNLLKRVEHSICLCCQTVKHKVVPIYLPPPPPPNKTHTHTHTDFVRGPGGRGGYKVKTAQFQDRGISHETHWTLQQLLWQPHEMHNNIW